MTTIIIVTFLLGYISITFENKIHIDKAASALLTGVICWTIYILNIEEFKIVNDILLIKMGEISSILFFLLGAMTIVELIDSHKGFDIIKSKITTTSFSKLLILIATISFFLSALLDNLTTAIVMTSLVSKLISDKEIKMYFASVIILTANAGGAWSPLGDVTTTMLWIGGQITPLKIITSAFIPSLAVCIFPIYIISRKFKDKKLITKKLESTKNKDSYIILLTGIALLILVPIFKTITHLPPFMGMLLALGIMWIVISIIHFNKDIESKNKFSVSSALQKIDTPSILFFLGILLSISALENVNVLEDIAHFLKSSLSNDWSIGIALGLLSAILDNVPLVAASQSMFNLTTYPTDHYFWNFLALTTGTGGSIFIIGSAAGVAVMGLEQINFGWYLKKIGWLALVGYLIGAIVFILQYNLFL